MSEQSHHIDIRVTTKEKEKINQFAAKCGLSTSEYLRQRGLRYEPRAVPPDALFACLEKLGELEGKASSLELDGEIRSLLQKMTTALLLPGKGG